MLPKTRENRGSEMSNAKSSLCVIFLPFKNNVTFKITIRLVIDQMIILKVTLLFNKHLINIYITCKITSQL
jgi:hypothetical protein